MDEIHTSILQSSANDNVLFSICNSYSFTKLQNYVNQTQTYKFIQYTVYSIQVHTVYSIQVHTVGQKLKLFLRTLYLHKQIECNKS